MKKLLFSLMLSASFFALNAQIEEGIRHMENENYVAALEIFNSICKADPKDVEAIYYTGETFYLMEQYKDAESAFRKGLANNTQCAECYIGLGKLELDKGNVVEAEKNFANAIRINKKSAATQYRIGEAYLNSRKPNANKAIEYLTNARDLNTKNASYWARLGDAYQLAGNYGEAVSHYEAAVEKDPNNVEAIIKMARIWGRAKQETLAIQNLERAMQLAPNDARPIKDLYELYIRQRQYAKVIPLLEKYITLIGTDVDAKVRLVKFLTYQAKDYDRAISEGEKLLAAHPDQYTLHRWLAWAYASKAKEMEGDKPPKVMDPAVRELYAKAYDHSKRLFDALSKDESRQAYPEDYDFWALSALKTGDLKEAAHVYRKYLEFEPSKAPEIYSTLAKTYYDSADYPQAIAYYKRKAELLALANSEEYYKGLSHYKLEQYPAADSSFARIVTGTPDYVIGWWYRAQIAEQIDSTYTTFAAKPFYEKVIETGVADIAKNKKYLADAYFWLGVYYAKQEDNDKALEHFGKVLELEPDNEDAQKYIKIIREQR